MLQVFGFGRVAVAVSELYFVDPDPHPGQEGAEHGVRLEVRRLELGEPQGSIYAARPITVGRPLWRADLLESVDGVPGSFDRTHHHPDVQGWEPWSRRFDPDMSADPLGWVGRRLSDLDGLLDDAKVDVADRDPDDAARVRDAVPDIVGAVERLLADVRAGRIAAPPAGAGPVPASARTGWL